MADPINPPDPSVIDASTESISKLADSAERYNKVATQVNETTDYSQGSLKALDGVTNAVTDSFKNLSNGILAVKDRIASMNSLTSDQGKLLSGITVAAIGMKEQFRNIGDPTGIFTFKQAIQSLHDTAENKSTLVNLITSMGQKVPEAARKSFSALKDFAMNLLTGADNARLAQNAMLQMASASGKLSDIYRAAGPNLQDLNRLTQQYMTSLNTTAKALHLNDDEVQKYSFSLGKIPNALSTIVEGTRNASGSMDMLTATVSFARGANRDYESVIQDLSTVYRDFGATGKAAFDIVSGLGEVANKTGVSFDSIHNSLLSSAGGLKEFTNGGKSAVEVMNGLSRITVNYVEALKNTGLSADVSVGIIKNMIDHIGKLTTAQKSFLSAQGGGPGGLRGANIIDTMIRRGDIEGVFEMAQKAMRKQFGTIITQEQATQSEALARQFEKQKLLLQKGPLGSLVQSDQQAVRFLEALSGKERGQPANLDFLKDTTSSTIEKGNLLQQQSNNILTQIAVNTSALQRSAAIPLAETTQEILGTPMDINQQANMEGILNRGVTNALSLQGAMKTGTFTEDSDLVSVHDTFNSINQTLGTIGKIPQALNQLKETGTNMINVVSETPESTVERDRQRFEQNLQNVRNQPITATTPITNRVVENTINPSLPRLLNQQQLESPDFPVSPATRLNNTVKRATDRLPEITKQTEIRREVIQTKAEPTESHINVHVKGYCLKCQNEILGGDQVYSVNPSAKQTP